MQGATSTIFGMSWPGIGPSTSSQREHFTYCTTEASMDRVKRTKVDLNTLCLDCLFIQQNTVDSEIFA